MADADDGRATASRRGRASPTRRCGSTRKGFERALKHDDRLDAHRHDPALHVGKISQAQPEPHRRAAARRPARHRRNVQGERRAGRARQPHGGVRLQFRGRHSGRRAWFRWSGKSSTWRKSTASRSNYVTLADTMAWATPLAIKRVGRRAARALARSRHRAASARHPRHGDRQCLCRPRNGRDALRRRRSPGSAAARSPATPARPAMSAPRTWSSCATKWASRPASISTR